MVNAKQRRVIKSREHNPLWKRDHPDSKRQNFKDQPPSKRPKIGLSAPNVGEDHQYSGVKSKPGEQKTRSRFNIKNQALLHNKVRKTEKKQFREAKKLQQKKRDIRASRKEVKVKYLNEFSIAILFLCVSQFCKRFCLISAEARCEEDERRRKKLRQTR